MKKFKLLVKFVQLSTGQGTFSRWPPSLKDELKREFDTIICIDNGASVAVIGEYNFGIGKGKQNIAYINCGVGIRTGIISSGVLIRTINNLEDAFGHMVVEHNGEVCSCGNSVCIGKYLSKQ